MAEVIHLSHHVEKTLERKWCDTLMAYLEQFSHPLFPAAIPDVIANALVIMEDTGLRLGAIVLGLEFWFDDNEVVLHFHDRYDNIEFTDRGSTRTKELSDDEAAELRYDPYMAIVVRNLTSAEKLQVNGLPKMQTKDLMDLLLKYSETVEEIPGQDYSVLIVPTISVPYRLAYDHGYGINSVLSVEKEGGGSELHIQMRGHGQEIRIVINYHLLCQRYNGFIERYNAWKHEFDSPAQEVPMKKGTSDC